MDEDVPPAPDGGTPETAEPAETHSKIGSQLVRWGIVLLAGLSVLLIPTPEGITPNSWRLLAIFVATITGSIVRPVPGGAVVLLGVSAIALTGVLPVRDALSGYADPMFLTGQASNVLIAKFAQEVTGIELTYSQWALGAVVPGVLSLIAVPLLLYRIFPPEVKHTPAAAELAALELKRMGRMAWGEKMMLIVFALVAGLWMTTAFHGINYAVVALVGICVLLLSGVLSWEDVISERSAWDVFIWYGGLVRMAEALGETGITKRFAETAAGFTSGWKWWAALAVLLLVYFYAHYGFASITAHATAMYIPFLTVILAAGAPPYLAVLSLAYFSNLDASLTHYGTTPAPIYFGAGYVTQRRWWLLGLLASLVNIPIWVIFGFSWWKLLKLW